MLETFFNKAFSRRIPDPLPPPSLPYPVQMYPLRRPLAHIDTTAFIDFNQGTLYPPHGLILSALFYPRNNFVDNVEQVLRDSNHHEPPGFRPKLKYG